jgi:hypothetical protein
LIGSTFGGEVEREPSGRIRRLEGRRSSIDQRLLGPASGDWGGLNSPPIPIKLDDLRGGDDTICFGGAATTSSSKPYRSGLETFTIELRYDEFL